MVACDGRRDFVPVGFGASHGRTRHPVNAGGSGASNSGWTARTGAAEPPAKTLRHAHRRRLRRFDRTIQQGRSRAGRQRLPTQTAVARFPPYRPLGKRKRETLICSSGGWGSSGMEPERRLGPAHGRAGWISSWSTRFQLCWSSSTRKIHPAKVDGSPGPGRGRSLDYLDNIAFKNRDRSQHLEPCGDPLLQPRSW